MLDRSFQEILSNSLQEVQVGVCEEYLVGGVVYGQGVGPLQLGGDDGTGAGAIHANSANVGLVTPVCPVQPTGIGEMVEEEKGGGGGRGDRRAR